MALGAMHIVRYVSRKSRGGRDICALVSHRCAAMAGNDIVGGAIGAGMDVPTGAMLELTPNPPIATMQPAIRTVAASKGSNGCC